MESRIEKHSPQKRQKLCDDSGESDIPVDRISKLPESIICHIFSFLPTKTVVATSFVSKSWKSCWTKVTNFHFDNRTWRRSSKGYDGDDVPRMNFVEFVHMVLLNHSPNLSINRFRLKLYNFKFESICFYTWVNIAIARNLRVLDLDIDFKDHNFRKDNYKSQLPGALYTCETLEVLKLSGLGVYIKVIRTVCLPKLTDLELKKVTYESDDSLRNLIPGCPLLQSLRIERHRQDNMVVCTIFSRVLKHFRYFFATTTGSNNNAALHFKLEIDAPALEFIDLTDFGSKEIISLQELRCLNEVYVHSSTPHKSTIGLLQAFHHVKSLVLSTTTMSTLMGANHRLILASFERLTKLFVPIDCCDQLRSVMDLIDSCAALEILNIMNNRSVQQSQSRNWRDPESVPKCLLNSVTEFSYSGFQGLEDEMAMFKFISKHALLLTRVHITSPLGWGPRPEEEFSSLEKIFMPSSGLYPERKIFFR